MSLRFKLTTVAIAVIVVANSLLSLVTLQYLGHVWLDEVQKRVRRNLNSARAAYQKRIDVIAAFLNGAATNDALVEAVGRKDSVRMRAELHQFADSRMMDFVLLLDVHGDVICRDPGLNVGDRFSTDPLVARVLRSAQPASGTVIYSQERLLAESRELADRAQIQIIATPAARPTSSPLRTNGMVIAAAAPVVDGGGRLLAVLYGGSLINRRYELVDTIKQEVFPSESYRGKDIGTVTIFQDDVRISTNVKMGDETRAIGTRMSASVCEVVLDRGEIWSAPAFVVNDWYITAYEPILEPGGRIIGSLYVGLLRAPFARQWQVVSGVFLAVVLGTTIASLVLLLIANELVLGPIRRVVEMAQRIIGGDMTARVGIRPPGEIGTLCWAIDSMAQAMAERAELLEQATRQQIGRSEQLASVGRLAAGVAHEINNPLVGVLAFADLMRLKKNMDEQDLEDLNLIIRETKRVREIVRGLLDFARETPSIKATLNINDVIRQTVLLLGKRDAFQGVFVVEDLNDDIPAVHGDKSQLQQVIMNLTLNACEAMPNGGTLVLSSAQKGNRVEVQVSDTGCGIRREILDRVMEPFFTTKPVGKGTGLGLAVSYGILQQHDGTLEVKSEVGRGSTFIITLPAVNASESAQPSGSATAAT
jgi:two-component system NtrC family sensor kinase